MSKSQRLRAAADRGVSMCTATVTSSLVVLIGLTVSLPGWGQVCLQPPPDIASWWPGDGNANDIIGTNNGTLQGGAMFAAGKVAKAFSFATSGDKVEIPNNSSLALETLPGATFEGWF